MALTDHSGLYGAIHEDGINLVVRHLMRQRPSLFNYATSVFHERPNLFCEKIEAAPSVLNAGNPLFTEQEPLPVLGAPFPLGINFCVQLTDAQVDFHPGNVFNLPPELGDLKEQQLALRARACAGLDCPSQEVIDEFLPAIERFLLAQQQLAVGQVEEKKETTAQTAAGLSAGQASSSAQRRFAVMRAPDLPINLVPKRDTIVLPARELICFCLEMFAVAHFEWGDVSGSQQPWLKARLDGLEIVDIQPTPMENAIECYVSTVLRLGILPRLMVPLEKMILDIAAQTKKWGLELGKDVTLEPATVPGDVPNNPAVEEDQLKAFANLVIS
jgi:hypothetical protein